MTTVYFVRHGEVHNPKKILYGRLPGFSLSQKGIEKVRETTRYFQKKKIAFIYHSPQLRAKQTAMIIASKVEVKPKLSKELDEVKLFCQGVPLDVYKNEIQSKLYTEEFLKNGQESIDSIRSRMNKFLQKVRHHHPNQNIVAVSHGDPIMILKASLEGVEFTWDYKIRHYLSTGNWIKVICDEK